MRKLMDIPEDELADFMQRKKKPNGYDYKPDSLDVMQGFLDCHLKSPNNNGKSHSILRDFKFAMFICFG